MMTRPMIATTTHMSAADHDTIGSVTAPMAPAIINILAIATVGSLSILGRA